MSSDFFAHIVRFFAAVLSSQVCIISVLCRVTVLEPSEGYITKTQNVCSNWQSSRQNLVVELTFIQSTGPKVEAQIRLSPYNLAPLHEFISAKLI